MADGNFNTEKYYADFWTWLEETYGITKQQVNPYFNMTAYLLGKKQSPKMDITPYWNVWQTVAKPADYTTVSTTRPPQLGNDYYITSLDSLPGADVKGYKDRVAEFIDSLMYDFVITPEQAASMAKDVNKAVGMVTSGQVGFDSLPFINELSRNDYPDWRRYYSSDLKRKQSDALSAYNKGEDTWTDYLKDNLGDYYNFYEKWLQDHPGDEQGAIDRAQQVQTEHYQGIEAANVVNQRTANERYYKELEQNRNALAATYAGNFQTQVENDKAKWAGEIPDEGEVLQNTIQGQGFVGGMADYFTPSRLYSLVQGDTIEDARAEWWNTVGGFTDYQQRYGQYKTDVTSTFTNVARQAGWQGADLSPDYFFTAEGRQQYADMEKAMKDTGVNINQTALLLGAPSDANLPNPYNEWISAQQRIAFPTYGQKPTEGQLGTDPLLKAAKDFPYLQHWLGLSPSQRGFALPTTRSRWLT